MAQSLKTFLIILQNCFRKKRYLKYKEKSILYDSSIKLVKNARRPIAQSEYALTWIASCTYFIVLNWMLHLLFVN